MLKRTLTIALVALTMAGTPVRAIEGGPAPFDGDLMRLAEILGALQYLRTLCGANEGNKWRDQMTASPGKARSSFSPDVAKEIAGCARKPMSGTFWM